MKRFFTLCMALLFAGSAFAQEVKQEEKKGPEFKYSINAVAYGVQGSQADVNWDYSNIRVRPTFSLSMGDIKAVMQFEIDQWFGKDAKKLDGSATTSADPGTDEKVVEVKHAYLEGSNVIIPKLTVSAGLNGYKFPWVVDNDFAMGNITYDFGMGKVSLIDLKVQENESVNQTYNETTGVKTKQNNDVDAYIIDLPIKIDAFKVRPMGMMIKSGKENTSYAEASLLNLALNASADFGIVALDATYANLSGTLNKDAVTGEKTKASGYAMDVAVDVKPMDMLKIGAYFTMTSGDDKATDDKDQAYMGIMHTLLGQAWMGRTYLIEEATTLGNSDTSFKMAYEDHGLTVYGINANVNVDKLKVFAQYAMISGTKKNLTTGKKKIGSEIDALISYEFTPKAEIFVELAYLMAGDKMEVGFYDQKAENVYQIGYGMKAKF